MMLKINVEKAVKMYKKCAEAYCDENRISAASRLYKKLGAIFEDEF